MEELISKLNELFDNASKYGVVEYPEDPGYLYFEDSDFYDEVQGLCCDHLITEIGTCNCGNIAELKDNGFRVFAGDSDSFGWLVGCIQKVGAPSALTLTYG